MGSRFGGSRAAIGVGIITAIVASSLVAAGVGSAGAAPSVRGFDGSTVTVAGLGIAAQFANDPIGAQARIKRFNDTNEIKGVKIKYAEFADDKQDPATALSESRRLVSQDGVFAIVGDVSQSNPVDYFTQQHVPYFGYAFDNTYCSSTPNKAIWGFGFDGCLVPSTPSRIGDLFSNTYKYVAQKTGKKDPTIALFSNDTQSGKNSTKFGTIAATGAGYKVVATNNQMPAPPVSDYSPYAQQMLTADNGKAPDAMLCLLSTDCISMWSLIKANGYTGTYITSLYADVLVKALSGTVANTPFVPLDQTTPGLTQLKKDLDAFQPGASAKIDTGTMAGYLSTDMFIQALKTAAKKGKSGITPENVQKAAANQTWEIKGLSGPTTYPQATVSAYQACSAEVISDGTAWKQVVPYSCSKKTYPNK
jgi:ABC-type branched-subunit amino acid transport system substrate-binding protein